jgi:hypothetical protein
MSLMVCLAHLLRVSYLSMPPESLEFREADRCGYLTPTPANRESFGTGSSGRLPVLGSHSCVHNQKAQWVFSTESVAEHIVGTSDVLNLYSCMAALSTLTTSCHLPITQVKEIRTEEKSRKLLKDPKGPSDRCSTQFKL